MITSETPIPFFGGCQYQITRKVAFGGRAVRLIFDVELVMFELTSCNEANTYHWYGWDSQYPAYLRWLKTIAPTTKKRGKGKVWMSSSDFALLCLMAEA